MKKEKSIQADIEVLEELMFEETLADSVIPGRISDEYVYARTEREKEALERTIARLEAMRDAEMPEKKDIDNYNAEEIGGKSWQRAIAFNEAISLCQPIVSNLLEENKELRKKIEGEL